MMYVRLYTDATGESHFADESVTLNTVDFAPPAAPLAISAFTPAAQFGFLRALPGWFGDWHPAPCRQILFYLTGEVEVRVSDGALRRFGPGGVLLFEDTTGKGHTSRVVSREDAVMAVVQLPNAQHHQMGVKSAAYSFTSTFPNGEIKFPR